MSVVVTCVSPVYSMSMVQVLRAIGHAPTLSDCLRLYHSVLKLKKKHQSCYKGSENTMVERDRDANRPSGGNPFFLLFLRCYINQEILVTSLVAQ